MMIFTNMNTKKYVIKNAPIKQFITIPKKFVLKKMKNIKSLI